MSIRRTLAAAALATASLTSSALAQDKPAAAPAPEKVQFSGFIQPTMGMTFVNDAPEGTPDRITDFYVRRIRLIAKGMLLPKLFFYAGTLTSDEGKSGTDKDGNATTSYKADTHIGDAILEYVFGPEAKLSFGLQRTPFARHSIQGASSLHAIDYHSAFHAQETGNVSMRDTGITLRGQLLDKKLDYRVAVVDGVEPGGEDDMPRFIGRVAYNFFDAESDALYLPGTYLGKKKVFNVGASFDLQPGVGGPENDELARAFAFDTFLDLPMNGNELVAAATFYLYGEGLKIPEGQGAWAEVGYRIDQVEPLVAVEWMSPKEGDAGKRTAVLGGLNYWHEGHTFNLKGQFGMVKVNDADDWSKTVLIQGQAAF